MRRGPKEEYTHIWEYPDTVTIGPLAQYKNIDGTMGDLYQELKLVKLPNRTCVSFLRGVAIIDRNVYDSIKIWQSTGGFDMELHEYINKAFA